MKNTKFLFIIIFLYLIVKVSSGLYLSKDSEIGNPDFLNRGLQHLDRNTTVKINNKGFRVDILVYLANIFVQ